MKKAAGFTLIELVIVIVILGILGAVAAPKFLNLQDDAYKANLNALKGSLNTAAILASSKAVLIGSTGTGNVEIDGVNVAFVAGFPAATQDGILKMLQDDAGFTENGNTSYNFEAGDVPGKIVIFPKAKTTSKSTCNVTYTEAVAAVAAGPSGTPAAVPAKSAKVKAVITGC